MSHCHSQAVQIHPSWYCLPEQRHLHVVRILFPLSSGIIILSIHLCSIHAMPDKMCESPSPSPPESAKLQHELPPKALSSKGENNRREYFPMPWRVIGGGVRLSGATGTLPDLFTEKIEFDLSLQPSPQTRGSPICTKSRPRVGRCRRCSRTRYPPPRHRIPLSFRRQAPTRTRTTASCPPSGPLGNARRLLRPCQSPCT
jgi:hypothetical protein